MYLRGRWPLPVHSNPFCIWKDDLCKQDVVSRSTALIIRSIHFYQVLNRVVIPMLYYSITYNIIHSHNIYILYNCLQKILQGQIKISDNECQSQYHYLYGTTRLPKEGCDVLLLNNYGGSSSDVSVSSASTFHRHIIVSSNKQMFKINVINEGLLNDAI